VNSDELREEPEPALDYPGGSSNSDKILAEDNKSPFSSLNNFERATNGGEPSEDNKPSRSILTREVAPFPGPV
ncbi:AAEL005007-PA, partial [Aedes aegypti]